MSEEINETNPYYQHLAHEYNVSNSPELLSAEVDSMLNDSNQLSMVDYYNNHTDFEHKERLKRVESQRVEYVTRINEHIDQNVPAPFSPEKPEEPKTMLGTAKDVVSGMTDPIGTGLKAASKLADTDIPVLKQYGQAAEISLDFLNGIRKSIAGTVAAVPQLVEDGLAAASIESQTLNDFNDKTSEIINDTYKSSGKYTANIKGYDVDVANLSGQILGHFALPVGVGKLVLNATKNAGIITKGMSLLASEAAVGAVLTDKDSGTLLNLFYEKDEHERLYPMLRMLHVDEDDSAFEARMKGALEGVLPVTALGAIKGTIESGRKAKSIIKGIRDITVVKQLNKKPSLAVDFLYANKGDDFSEAKFNDFVFKDYKKDAYDYLTNSTFKYLKDEEGAIFIGKKERMAGLVEKARNNLLKNIEEKEVKLSKVEKNSPEAKQLRKEILAIKKNADEIGSFNEKFLTDLKKGDFKDSTESLKQLSKKMPTLKKEHNLDIELKKFDDQVEFIKDLKKSDLTTYNKLKNIFNNKSVKDLTPDDINDFDFLSTLNKKGFSYDDFAELVSNPEFTSKETTNILQTFYKTDDIKKYSDAELAKRAKDVVEVYGGNPEAIDKMSREGLLSFPEAVAADHLLLKNGFEELAKAAENLNKIKAQPGNKKELQVHLVNFLDKQAGYNKLVANMTQRRSDAGTSLRLYSKSPRTKVMSQVAKKEFQELNFSDPEVQAQFFEKILHADPAEVKRISSEISDLFSIVKKDKLTMNEALKEMAYRSAKSKLGSNVKLFFYNNMLSSFGTFAKNLGGLHLNKLNDDFTELIAKMSGKSDYYNADKFDTESLNKILKVMDQMDAHEEATLEFLKNSKFLSGFYDKKTGKMKTKKTIFKDSFTVGKSMLDPGGEKYGVGYKSLTEAEKMVLGYHKFTFGNAPSNDEIAMRFFKDQILNDTNKIQQEFFTGSPWQKLVDVHSMPLRTLNAMDEAYKAKIVYEKMLLGAKRKVNGDLLKLQKENPKAYSAYMDNLQKNYTKDMKRYLNNGDNFDEAISEARNITLTKQYGNASGENFTFMGMDLGEASKVFLKHPVINFFHPFARISLNISDYLTQYLPGAYVSKKVPFIGGMDLSLNRFNKKIALDLEAGGYRAAKARAKAQVGTLICSTAYGLASQNIITGNAPADAHGRRQWKELGIKEKSLNVGDVSIPINTVDPMGKFLVAVADFRNAISFAMNNDDEGMTTRLSAVGAGLIYSVAQLAGPEVLVDGMLGLSRMASEWRTRGYSALAYQVGKGASTLTGKAVPFSSLVRNMFRDDLKSSYVEYDKDGMAFLDTVIKGFTSVYGDTGNVTQKNIFNDDVYYHSVPKAMLGEAVDQDYINQYAVTPMVEFGKKIGLLKYHEKRQDPIYKKLRDLVLHLPEQSYKARELPLPRLSRTLRIQNESVTLDNKQYRELIGYTNGYNPDGSKFMKPMKEYLNELVQTQKFNKYPEELQSELIRSVIREYHKAGRNMFKAMNKQFQDDAIEKINERMGIE